MRGTFPVALIVFFLFLHEAHSQQPPAEVAPASASMPVPPPVSAPAPTDQAKRMQGNMDPNLNPRPGEATREALPLPPLPPEAEARPLLKEWTTTFTLLPTADKPRDFGVFSIETAPTLQIPFADDLAPLLLRPGFGVHFWQQPSYREPLYTFGLPDTVYDLYLDLGWQPRLAEWLFADVGITPGFYTDFGNEADNGFRLRGRALGIFAFSEELQVVAGAIAANRNRVNWLPAGGVLWSPHPDTRINLVFPAPKIAQRVRNDGSVEWWLYLAGEFGGGTWAVRRGGFHDESIDYNDLRLNVGFEWKVRRGLSGLMEVGYVFDRELYFANSASTFRLNDTVMLRLGLVY